ncbi:NAD(P)H-dependent oxidoreductase [Candidatus Parcubacteria bacterium]|nr:NAD(P)H-dependent oxidoreductase [Candidatus Parcubacteria bacterium]
MFGLGTQKKKKIYIFLGQEDKETFCGALADEYEKGAKEGGHEVRRANIGDLKFDPLLHKGYKVIQELEPDLKKVQEDMRWAEHIVVIYPTWWSMMPAILKGFFDRVWIPGFAFHFHPRLGWDKLLKGRTGHVFITMDSWPLLSRMLFGDSTNEIGRAILGFAGIHPVNIQKIGPLKHATDARKQKIKEKIYHLGLKGK